MKKINIQVLEPQSTSGIRVIDTTQNNPVPDLRLKPRPVLQIEIPAIEDTSIEGFKKYCEHFHCKCITKNKKDAYWKVTAEDPLNFFWLGMNLHFVPPTSLTTTTAEKYLYDNRKK